MNIPTVRIDPSLVPDCDYDLACSILFSSISRALSDPDLKKEYEEWKSQNASNRGDS